MKTFGINSEGAISWDRRFYFLLLLVFLWRLFYIVIVPLDLAPDEAYYWDWSRQLDWGYYDKPPITAWIVALSTGILGSNSVAVRLPAAILVTVGTWALYLFAKRLYGPRIGFWSVVAGIATPGNCALGLVMTIDTPLSCFWCLSLYTLWRVLEKPENGSIWWLLSAITIGLGLLSKQTMGAFLGLIPLFLLLNRETRPLIKRPWLYSLIVLPVLLLIPTLWWNMKHNWITFFRTTQQFSGHARGFWYSFVTFFEHVGLQLLVVSPLTCILFVVISARLLFSLDEQNRSVRYLLVFSMIPLIGVAGLSFHQRILANWPLVFYPAGMVLLAAWGCGAVSLNSRLDRWRRFFLPAIGVGVWLTALTYALPWLIVMGDLDGSFLDITFRLKGWRQLGAKIGAILAAQPEPDKTFLLTTRRQFASELAFYAPNQPDVFIWPDQYGRIRSQYDIWDGPIDKIGWNSLIVLEARQKPPLELMASFRSMKDNGEISIPLGRMGNRRFSLYSGDTLKSWDQFSVMIIVKDPHQCGGNVTPSGLNMVSRGEDLTINITLGNCNSWRCEIKDKLNNLLYSKKDSQPGKKVRIQKISQEQNIILTFQKEDSEQGT